MQQSGEFRIPATRERVWAALNDPSVLQRCIDGCEELQRGEGDRFLAKVRAKVGPVSATFAGEVELRDLQPPDSYTLVGAGKGGAAGFAKGEAKVRLSELTAQETLLQYEVNANVGGKLAQIGSRLVDGAARKFAEDFFARFVAVLAESAPPVVAGTATVDSATTPAEVADAHTAAPPPQARYEPSGQTFVWVVVFGITVAALLLAAL